MKGWTAFAKKELLEQLRGGKILILFAVLFLFGMTSPLLAKLTPQLLKSLSLSGVTIILPKATAADAWAQFFKNVSQMGMIVLILIFGMSLPQEIARGTLLIPLSKGLSRSSVLLAKYLTALLDWTVGYGLAACVCCGYTLYLFGRFALPHLFFALFCLWLFGAFLLALLLCAGVAVPGNYGGLLLAALALGVLLALDVFPRLQKWDPASLAAQSASVLAASADLSALWGAVWAAAAGSLFFLLLAGALFHKRSL